MAVLTRRALVVLLLLFAGCASQHVVIDRLFFGTNIPSGGKVSDDDWKTFVREVITPKLKDGLTIFEANGQWLDPRGDLVREHVMVVEVAHAPSGTIDADLRAIANEYKKRFKQDAVLRVTVPANVAFY
jgi:Protein of unknown function (DUF3574)